MFTAGGRLRGAKIGDAERAAMQQYIEVFKTTYPTAKVYEALGMAEVDLTDEEAIALRLDTQIQYVTLKPLYTTAATVTQSSAPWHLSDITQETDAYTYNTTGEGVTVYVVDTGVIIDHPEFAGHAIQGYYLGPPTNDHGTHVAGIVGSQTYGVAKNSLIVDVQVFPPGVDFATDLWGGLNWILTTYLPGTPAVANLSLGSQRASHADALADPSADSLRAMVADGIVVVVAAGNDNLDCDADFPAAVDEVIAVAAHDLDHMAATFTNYGHDVAIFAPGVEIFSTVFDYAVDAKSGTSMAAPCVAGICARYLELCPGTAPADLKQRIKDYGIASIDVTGRPDTTNKRINVNMPGIRSTIPAVFNNALTGSYKQKYLLNSNWYYGPVQTYGVAKTLPTLIVYPQDGSVVLATEIIKVIDVVPDNPIVIPPAVLPPPVDYDGGMLTFDILFRATFNGITYVPTSHVGDLYTYDYPGVLYATLEVGLNNAYTLSTISQLPITIAPIVIDGSLLTINPDNTITYKGVTRPATSSNGGVFIFDYPGIIQVDINPTTGELNYTSQVVLIKKLPIVIAQGGVVPVEDDLSTETAGTWEGGAKRESFKPLRDVQYFKMPRITRFEGIRVIAIDFADYTKLANVSLSLTYPSGTFSYSGIGLTLPATKSAVTVQGHNGRVERVNQTAARGSVPQSIEGRLLPLFTTEMIYICKPKFADGSYYWTRDIVSAVAAQAGTTVSFLATNTEMESFDFTGRFTDALAQLAEASCGDLLQQNGTWKIVPKVTYSCGTYNVLADDIISYTSDIQGDITDTVVSLLNYLKQAILDRDAALREISRVNAATTSGSGNTDFLGEPKPVSLPGVNFTFGWNGKNMVEINENIVVDTFYASNWDTWPLGTNASQYYYKREPVSDSSGQITHMRGLKSLLLTDFYYPITPPTGVKKYLANGALANLDMALFICSPRIVSELPVKVMNRTVTGMGDHPTVVPHTYINFRIVYPPTGADNAANDKNFYSGQLDMYYVPKPDTGGSSPTALIAKAGMARNIAIAKITCIEKELASYGVDSSSLVAACALWKKYYDLVFGKDNNMLPETSTTQPIIDAAEWAATQATGAAMISCMARVGYLRVTNVTALYNNMLPLAANLLTVQQVQHAGIITDCGIIQSVSFNGQTVSIVAHKRYAAV